MASEVEQNIVSVERILYYVELSPEAPYEISEAAPGNNWPLAGEVVFRSASENDLSSPLSLMSDNQVNTPQGIDQN